MDAGSIRALKRVGCSLWLVPTTERGPLSGSKPNSSANSLEGVLERITFYNEENGFLIGKLKGGDKTAEIAVVGKAPKVQCGETLVLLGKWVNHPKHGRQFSFDSFESKLPASAYGIRKYLASGLIHGIERLMPIKLWINLGPIL